MELIGIRSCSDVGMDCVFLQHPAEFQLLLVSTKRDVIGNTILLSMPNGATRHLPGLTLSQRTVDGEISAFADRVLLTSLSRARANRSHNI